MSAQTVSLADAIFKELYPKGKPADTMTRRRPFLRMVPKKGNWTGDNLVIPVRLENIAGRAAIIAKAKANAAPSQWVKFNISARKTDYAIVEMTDEAIMASMGDDGAFVEVKSSEMDSALDVLGKSAAHALYRDGWGAIGVIASFTGSTITLVTASDAFYFTLASKVIFADGSDGSTPRDTSQALTVSAVDESTGIVTFTEAMSEITGLANGDYVFIQGDNDQAGTAKRKFEGLGSWNPRGTPASLFGVTRTTHRTRLGGHAMDATGMNMAEVPIRLADRMYNSNNAEISHGFINPLKFTDIAIALNVKVEYQDAGGEVGVGFERIRIHYSGGSFLLYPDPDAVADEVRLVNINVLELRHLGDFPHIVTTDGLTMQRLAAADGVDGVEARCRYFAELTCKDPSQLGVAYNLGA